MSGTSGLVTHLVFEVDRAATLEIPASINAGESLVADGTGAVRLYDAKGRQIDRIDLKEPFPRIGHGSHAVAFDCVFSGDLPPVVEVTFKTKGTPEGVTAIR